MAEKMRAVGYRKPLPISDPASLEDLEIPVPEPGPRDLLVRVEAVSVNPVDVKVRASTDPGREPKILGYDAAGVVVASFGIGGVTGALVARPLGQRFGTARALLIADIGLPDCETGWRAEFSRRFRGQASMALELLAPQSCFKRIALPGLNPVERLRATLLFLSLIGLSQIERRQLARVVACAVTIYGPLADVHDQTDTGDAHEKGGHF